MKVLGAVLGSFLVGVNGLKVNMEEDRVLHIPHGHMSTETQRLLETFDADQFGSTDEGIHFKLSPEAVRALSEQNVDFEDTTQEWISHFENNLNDPNLFCNDGVEACAGRDMQSFHTAYQSLAALHARMENVANSVSFASIGSIGTSFEGRDQKTINIGDSSKPLVFYFCNIHAREWLTPMFCMYMAETLVENGGHPLLDTFSFTILVSANPDGYEHSRLVDNLWRKTRKPNPGSSCVGTDPNRNYDNRHCGVGTSNNPCSQTFCGRSPFDQDETANIRDFGLANAGRIIAMNDVHSYGRLWLSPYGGISSDPPQQDFQKQQACNLAAVQGIQEVSGGSLWSYGPVYSTIYPAAGVSVDWFYDTVGTIYSMSAELRGTNFQPSASNIIPSNLEMFAAMESSLQCVGIEEGLIEAPPGPAPTPFPTPAPTPCNFFFC